jgi:hypothetical protein
MRKLLLFAVLPALVLALASCTNNTSCTRVIGITARSASCRGWVDHLEGSQRVAFNLKDVAFGGSVDARILIRVASGSVNVAYRNGAGQYVETRVYAGSPMAIEDALRLVFISGAEITLTSADGAATGIEYLAEFTS